DPGIRTRGPTVPGERVRHGRPGDLGSDRADPADLPGSPRVGEREQRGLREMRDAQVYLPGDPELRSILGEARTIAVVGLSSNPGRESLSIAKYLQDKGYRIVPVNPNETEVLGEKAYSSRLDVPDRIDAVDVFLLPVETPE